VQNGIDASFLVEQISTQAREDRWAGERDDYDQDAVSSTISDAEKIDAMFSELIRK
jgi:hypothetical protein